MKIAISIFSFLLITAMGCLPLLAQPIKILACTKTNGFRHKAMPAATAALTAMAKENNWEITFTEDSLAFSNYKALKKYNAILFVFATGKIFGEAEEQAFQKYMEKGGAFVSIHTGTDVEKNWPWYMGMVGAAFKNHPKQQNATYLVVDSTHPSTKYLPREWQHFDEIYNFAAPLPANFHVLMEVKESSYSGGTMGKHPIAWYGQVKKARVFQTALGHTDECYTDKYFLQHLLGGIKWAMKIE
ncbi:ThuA domain-containing protein [Parasediminibacterium sp. JCM 36343]|uniref:ThuA domain-containing protein n=1 Tax=Parasediminibacterium sp. JCM 36343 TaxID=3374279 RepID=UPI00397E027B